MTRRLRIGFLMDPLEGVRVDHDTTFLLMLAAQARGHEVRTLEQPHLYFRGDRVHAAMRTVEVRRQERGHFNVVHAAAAPLDELDVLFLRKDPPVDPDFLHATQLVELTPGRGPLLVNSPQGLRDANEKLFALHFSHLMPPTVVSASAATLRSFVEEVGEAVLKPVDGFGGKGIFLARAHDKNLQPLVEMATGGGRHQAIVQKYLPASRAGDKRILLLDGEPMGAVLRVPREDDVRANMAAGGKPVKTELTAREKEICRTLAPALVARGLHFVGIDVIGDFLTEVNVTSPTGAAEIEALDGIPVGERVMQWVEAKVAAR